MEKINNGTVTMPLAELDKLRQFVEKLKSKEGGYFQWPSDNFNFNFEEYWYCKDEETQKEIKRLKEALDKERGIGNKLKEQMKEIATSRKARRQFIKDTHIPRYLKELT